jgi:hypothetical protein
MRSSFAFSCLFTSLFLAACDEEPAAPGPAGGTIVVHATTRGEGGDPGGFRLTIDGSGALLLEPNGRVLLTGVSEGTHLIQLVGLPANCSVEGPNPRAVSVGPGGRSDITFAVTCGQRLSSGFSISVMTTGTQLDADGYGLSVVGEPLRRITINALEVFTGLEPGVHLVTLEDLAEGCSLVGGNPQPYTVVKDKVVQVRLQVACG